MTKKEIEAACISVCRYYKGEEECPFVREKDKEFLWYVERSWVSHSANVSEENFSGDEISEYIGYVNDFRPYDGIPLSLKARIFNRFAKGYYSMLDAVEPFKSFISKYYTAE